MNIAEKVREAGVVGAGGGGFPAHVKLAAKAEFVIANGAECEPLLHKDAAVMEHAAAGIVRGMQVSMEATGAREGIVGIKAKNKHAVEAMEASCKGTAVRVHLLGDYYPAGDEYDLVYETTGRLIPPAGIPIQVGAVVNNVETLLNIAAAQDGKPVIDKWVTIAGAVNHPVTLRVPVGMTYREVIESTGGFACPDPVLVLGGMMMGQTSTNLDEVISKNSGGVVVLPRSHKTMERKLTPARAQAAIGKSACDQCRYCTEFCPRFLLGYDVQPHAVMRSLGFTATGSTHWNQFASLCCSCGLCTLFACPEGLFPKEACDDSKTAMRAANQKWSGPPVTKTHPMRDGRRVPIKALMKRLGILDYDHPAHFEEYKGVPRRALVALKQGAGAPCVARVKAGDAVAAAQKIGEVPEGALGAPVHAPFAGRVETITDKHIVITRTA